MKQRTLIILRGASGAGKTSFCDLIQDPKVVICADDFFYHTDGSYHWDGKLIGRAHENCRNKFDWVLMYNEIDNIIIANTNTKPSDWKYYEDKALEAGLKVVFVVLEHRHDGVNQHSVPVETLERQANTIKQNLKLL